ncbi:MAG TPA: protoglobin domain-containing protein [Terrimesophilobacter sp.]|nr:protoglobin domain-containing protein [Terrimesophilobacter sp.]
MSRPHGYIYEDTLPASPVTVADLEELKASVLWSDDDTAALRKARGILVPQTEQILDVWYGFVGATPHLVATFAGADGKPDGDYLAKVRERFGKWIDDVCGRDYDETWLAYQEEIARRHHPSGKNATDSVSSTSPSCPSRSPFGASSAPRARASPRLKRCTTPGSKR